MQDKLNGMDAVASIRVPQKKMSKKEAAKWAVDELKKTGYQVDRQGYGLINFSKNDIDHGMLYANSDAEKMSILALPMVLKRGIEVGNHANHKSREKATITIAAPVEFNGVRGNMAAVIVLRGNHYYTHRILAPDGSAITFWDEKKDATHGLRRGVVVSNSLADDTRIASKISIPNPAENVNGKKSYSLTTPAELKSKILESRDAGERPDVRELAREIRLAAVKAQYKAHGIEPSDAEAENEVVCNAAPAILQDELMHILLHLYMENETWMHT